MPAARKQVSKGTTTTLARGKKGGKKKTEESARPIKHKDITAVVHLGKTALTADDCKELLGWEEETEGNQFGESYLFKTPSGKKVRCTNNVRNRPLYMSTVNQLKQEHLRKRWKFNGEPIIIGVTGLVLNGQHTLISLVLAAEEYTADPDKYPLCDQQPVMEKLVVFGVSEDDHTVNTMDTCKPRSLADVIYRAHYFKKLNSSGQRVAARLTQEAIRRLWDLSGRFEDAYGVKPTHAEAVDFLERHPRLLDAVRHVYEEDNNEGKIGRYLPSRGYAAAALYLMGSCKTDSDKYYTADRQEESLMDFSEWDKACTFFVELASGAAKLRAVHEKIIELLDNGMEGTQFRWAVLVKAWQAYVEGAAVDSEDLELKVKEKEGVKHLAEHPCIGGIDVGQEGLPFTELTPEEIEEGTTAVKARKYPTASHVQSEEGWTQGDVAWVHNELCDVELVTLSGEPFQSDSGWKVLVDAPDGDFMVHLENLSLSKFELQRPDFLTDYGFPD